jgi:hypothetical protein
MSVRNPWARHYQSIWHDRAGDDSLPNWLRVAALAYGAHKANGHAMFEPRAIGLVLARVDRETGVVTELDSGNVKHAIDRAVQAGWLAEGSGARCLVVPGHAISGGLGRTTDPCPQHTKRCNSDTAKRLKAVS